VVGITVKKAIGKAVLRNKLRRRLSAILHDALATYGPMRLLLVAQSRAADLPFADLRAEVTSALERA
jgi:ribonuclease P protein component